MNKKGLFNPLNYDFSVEFLDDDNIAHILTMPSMEISYFEGYKYDFMRLHLAMEIYHQRGQKTNPEDDLKEITKEIQING